MSSSPIATTATAKASPFRSRGEAWLSYVPLSLPWALVVRERLPPGAAAVLINRAHAYPDLALAINAAQDAYCAVDGRAYGRRDS